MKEIHTRAVSVPKEYIKPIEMGIKEAMEGGVLAGYPMVDVKATLYDGSYRGVDLNELAFKIRSVDGLFRVGAQGQSGSAGAGDVGEIMVPEARMGKIIGGVNSRRGRIEGLGPRAGWRVVKSMVPLSEMFGTRPTCAPIRRAVRLFPCTLRATERPPPFGGGRDRGQDAG